MYRKLCISYTRLRFPLHFLRYYKTVRVRFAPSPTGYLHLGGLRTALYNFLFAKSHNGKFILRIEDTDQSRLVEGAADELQKDINWAGIYIDEGPKLGGHLGPYVQSQRRKIYSDQIQTLLKNGSAYYCFCTDKRLELLRKEATRARQVPKYDNRCRHLTFDEVKKKLDNGEPHCIRFKLTSGAVTFNDLIYGNITYDVTLNEGDPVIIKSDGYPTYHFANVVDDHFMHISHVLRGVEWQISTTKHILLFRAFGWDPPLYGHLPLLLNADGTKLSKRQGDIQISHYRKVGILPQALVNFITHSGGGFEKDLEKGVKPKSYSMDELAKQFDVKLINSHSGKIMSERLLEFNRLELEKQINNEENLKILIIKLQKLVKQHFENKVPDNLLNVDENHIKSILKWSVNRISKLNDLVSKELLFLWIIPKCDVNQNTTELKILENLQMKINENEDLNKDSLKVFLRNFAEENNVKFQHLMKLLRSILSGLKEGPSVAEMMEILGKEATLHRIDTYLKQNVK